MVNGGIGRSSDFWAECLSNNHRFPRKFSVLDNGVRSQLPLRDSSGFAPDSLLPRFAVKRTKTDFDPLYGV